MARSNLSEQLLDLAAKNDEHAYNLVSRAEDLDYAVDAYCMDRGNPERIVILIKAWVNANAAYSNAAGKYPPLL